MSNTYSLKCAFDNRYKNTMIFSLFFIFGLSLIMFIDLNRASTGWFDSVIYFFIVIVFDLFLTLNRYIHYRHLSKHGVMIKNIKYKIISKKGEIGYLVKYSVPNKGMIDFKYYRHSIDKKDIGKVGTTDIIIDLKHPKYYYIFK